MARLIAWLASGLLAAMPLATSCTLGSSSACGTTTFTSPMRKASCASISRPVMHSSRA